jgi:hypothetical protein
MPDNWEAPPALGSTYAPLARRLHRQALLAVNSVYGCKTSFCARQFSNSPTQSTFSDGQASA